MPDSKNVWYVRRGTAVSGPFPRRVIDHHQRQGRLRDDDELSNDLKSWRRAGEIAELRRSVTPSAQNRPLPRSRSIRHSDAASGPPAALIAARYLRLLGRPSEHRALPFVVLAVALLGFAAAGLLGGGRAPMGAPKCAAPAAPGIDWQGCVLDGLDAPRSNLEGAKLRSAKLRNAVLFAARLGGAEMAYADLSGADLSYSDLNHADLTGVNLRGADLSYSNLRDANLRYAALTGASLARATLTGAKFGHALWLDGRECPATAVGGCR